MPGAARKQAALAGALAFCCALALASAVPGLADTDPWSHLEYARQLWASGFRLRGHPFLPLTALGTSGVDLWWGFHLLLVPFGGLGLLWGARLAGAVIAAAVAGSLAAILCKLGRRVSWPFAVAPLLLSASFAIRGHVARPAQLTIPLLFVQLACGFSALPVQAAGAAAFVHGLLHLSSPLSPAVCAFGAVAAASSKGKPSPRAVLWAIGGLALAFLVRPDRAQYLPIAMATNLVALGFGADGRLPHAGSELSALSFALWFREAAPGLALLAAAWLAGRGRPRSGSTTALAAFGVFTALCGVMTLRSLRFVDYFVPGLAALAALLWPAEPFPATRRLRGLLGVGAVVCGLLLLAARVEYVAEAVPPLIDQPQTYQRVAAAVRERVPPGEMLFTDDPFMTEVLYAHLPEYTYLYAYDPAVLYLASPALFWRWHHAVTEATACDFAVCRGTRPSGAAVARAMRSIGARWAVTSYPRGRLSGQEAMAADAARFDLELIAPGSSNGLYLWRLKP
jgi:hypothetical protein